MEKQYEKIEGFKDHSNCPGHANFILDCEYETKDQRDLLVSVINNYVKDETN